MILETNKYYKHPSGVCIVVVSKTMYGPNTEVYLIEQAGDPYHTISSLPIDSPVIDEMTEITSEEWILAVQNAERGN